MTRIASRCLCLAAGLYLSFGTGVSVAHHSGSKYDFGKLLTLEGTVREFQWTNPHAIIWVNVESEQSEGPELWAVQLTSPGNLRRNGWSHRSLQPGDRVRIDLHPLRDGGAGGGLNKVTIMESGEVLHHFPPRAGSG